MTGLDRSTLVTLEALFLTEIEGFFFSLSDYACMSCIPGHQAFARGLSF